MLKSGCGQVSLTCHGKHAVFEEVSATYPLKLLAPRVGHDRTAVIYLLCYGGGLVGGDSLYLSIGTSNRSTLVILSQGSTKVFKARRGQRSSVQRLHASPASATTQRLDCFVKTGSSLLLLPDPVTCFKDAEYQQTQTFHLDKGSSLVVLDWLTSGRKSLGEVWEFSQYFSLNEVRVDGKLLIRDVLSLEQSQSDSRTLRSRLAPYSCYANVILCGEQIRDTFSQLEREYQKISLMQMTKPVDLLWSWTVLTTSEDVEQAGILRVAGKETEAVKSFLQQTLAGLEPFVGSEVYKKAFL